MDFLQSVFHHIESLCIEFYHITDIDSDADADVEIKTK